MGDTEAFRCDYRVKPTDSWKRGNISISKQVPPIPISNKRLNLPSLGNDEGSMGMGLSFIDSKNNVVGDRSTSSSILDVRRGLGRYADTIGQINRITIKNKNNINVLEEKEFGSWSGPNCVRSFSKTKSLYRRKRRFDFYNSSNSLIASINLKNESDMLSIKQFMCTIKQESKCYIEGIRSDCQERKDEYNNMADKIESSPTLGKTLDILGGRPRRKGSRRKGSRRKGSRRKGSRRKGSRRKGSRRKR
jgi:hypothetical protein